MTKIFNKLLLIGTSALIISNNVKAEETICYKKDWASASTIEETTLDGGKCNSEFSVKQMQENGWNIVDIKIDSKQNLFDYTYVLSNDVIIKKEEIKENNIVAKTNNSNFSLKPIGVKIENIDDNKSKINVGNLIVGESGIVVHIYDDSRRIIVSNAKVISTNENESIVEFFDFDDLKQNAIPTTKRKVELNDILVLNYMYPASLLITPTEDSFQTVRENFEYNNFVHSDIFATKLKIDNQPYPTKEDIQKFAREQNLGTIFIVVDNKVHVIDTKTFEILVSYPINYEDKNVVMPFYTRVEEIEDSPFNFNFFTSKNNLTYNEHYKKILGL